MIQIIGYLSALLLVACGLPELYLGIKEGSVGASHGLLYMWFAGEVLGLFYVISVRKLPLIFNYGFNTLIVGALIALKLGYL